MKETESAAEKEITPILSKLRTVIDPQLYSEIAIKLEELYSSSYQKGWNDKSNMILERMTETILS